MQPSGWRPLLTSIHGGFSCSCYSSLSAWWLCWWVPAFSTYSHKLLHMLPWASFFSSYSCHQNVIAPSGYPQGHLIHPSEPSPETATPNDVATQEQPTRADAILETQPSATTEDDVRVAQCVKHLSAFVNTSDALYDSFQWMRVRNLMPHSALARWQVSDVASYRQMAQWVLHSTAQDLLLGPPTVIEDRVTLLAQALELNHRPRHCKFNTLYYVLTVNATRPTCLSIHPTSTCINLGWSSCFAFCVSAWQPCWCHVGSVPAMRGPVDDVSESDGDATSDTITMMQSLIELHGTMDAPLPTLSLVEEGRGEMSVQEFRDRAKGRGRVQGA